MFDKSRNEPTIIKRYFNSVKTTLPKQFEILFLSRLNFVTIKTSSLNNISCLYLWNLNNLESIEIENVKFNRSFRLKELFIEYCSKIVSISIDISTLNKLILNELELMNEINFNYRRFKYNFQNEFEKIKEESFEKESFQIKFQDNEQ